MSEVERSVSSGQVGQVKSWELWIVNDLIVKSDNDRRRRVPRWFVLLQSRRVNVRERLVLC